METREFNENWKFDLQSLKGRRIDGYMTAAAGALTDITLVLDDGSRLSFSAFMGPQAFIDVKRTIPF